MNVQKINRKINPKPCTNRKSFESAKIIMEKRCKKFLKRFSKVNFFLIPSERCLRKKREKNFKNSFPRTSGLIETSKDERKKERKKVWRDIRIPSSPFHYFHSTLH